MRKLCLVTYTRENEIYKKETDLIASELYKIYKDKFKVVIYCEKMLSVPDKDYEIEFIEMKGTKYLKLLNLLEKDNSEYFLSVDMI